MTTPNETGKCDCGMIYGVHHSGCPAYTPTKTRPPPPTDYAMALDSLRDMVEQSAALRARCEQLRAERDDFKTRMEAACAVARAQATISGELRSENERLRGLLERALGYTRCTPPCAGYDDALACKCGRVQLDDEISEAALGNAQEAGDANQ